MAAESRRHDAWWVEPLAVVVVLTSFGIYATWAAFQNANYYAAPYLSPFYSPCLAANCAHVTLALVGAWWTLSPAFLILGIPLGFRLTCYYYRKAYYRAFFWSPPACAVPDARRSYTGETRFPFVLQNLHRYFFWLSLVMLAFLWWDALLAFRFPTGFGIGLGTVILVANAALLSLYSFSCHSCRYLCGGYLDSFRDAPLRYRLWRLVNRLNARHALFAWVSLFGVALADLYVRLVATGVISDPRIVF
ncbi:MAG: succinate dehydrogenase [Chloroflexota bacterium]|nr:succinate dehydrogenase [Chloroflexota bacterium]